MEEISNTKASILPVPHIQNIIASANMNDSLSEDKLPLSKSLVI